LSFYWLMTENKIKEIHIVGAGGLARDFAACFRDEIKIAGFWDDHGTIGSNICGFPVLGNFSQLISGSNPVSICIAIGNPEIRKKLSLAIEKTNHDLVTIIHSSAKLFDLHEIKIDSGSIIFPGVHITTNVSIGTNTIIHNLCSLHHDTIIGSNCMLMPGVICAGNVEIGNEVYISPGKAFVYGTKIEDGERVL